MKKIIILFVILIVLLLGTLALIPLFFKDEIFDLAKTEINKNVNGKVNFGDFDLSVFNSFPDLSVSIDDLIIIGAGDFEKDTFANIPHLKITLDIMSVIYGKQIAVKTIILNEPEIKALILKDGRANWELAAASNNTTDTEQSVGDSKIKISLKNFEMNNAHIIYSDASIPFSFTTKGLTHKITGDFTQDIFDMKNEIQIDELDVVFDGISYLKKVKTTFNADIQMNVPEFKFTFKENELQLNQLFLGFDGFFAMPEEDMVMDIKFFTKQTTFKSLLSMIPSAFTTDFSDVKSDGKLSMDGFIKGIYRELPGDTLMPGFALNLNVDKARVQYPDLPSAIENISMDVKLNNPDGLPDNTVIDVSKFHMELDNQPFDAKLVMKTPVSDPDIDTELKGKLDLGKLTKAFPLEDGMKISGNVDADCKAKGRMSAIDQERYEDFQTDGKIAFTDLQYEDSEMPPVFIKTMLLTFNPRNVSLTQFDSKIGKSDLKADGTLDNYFGYALRDEPLKGSLNISSNLFDANEWLEEEAPSSAGSTNSSAASTDTVSLEIIEVPANIDFVLNTSMKKVLYDNMTIENVSGAIIVKDKIAKLNNLKMNMLKGEIIANGSYETTNPEKPKMDFQLTINNCDIAESFNTFNTVQKLAPIGKYTTGNFSTKMQLASDLNKEMMPETSTMNGSGLMVVNKAVVHNFQPLVKMAETLHLKGFDKYEFNNSKINFSIQDGRAYVKPFEIKDGDNKFNISGSSGIDGTLDYLVKADVPRKALGTQANALIDNLMAMGGDHTKNLLGDRIKVDVMIGGTFDNPIIKTGFQDNLADAQQTLKDKAKEEFDKKKKELEDKARQEAEKLKKEAEEKARQEAEKAKQMAKDAAEKKKKELEAKAKQEADKKKKEAEQKAKEIADKAKEEAKDKLKGIIKKK